MYIIDRKIGLNDLTEFGTLVELFQNCVDEMIEMKEGCQAIYIDIWATSEISRSIIEFIEAHFNEHRALRRIYVSVGYQINIVPTDSGNKIPVYS